ncbi:restriction endonuclease subunit S [Lactococcus formosensis]|uniref:Restriction endonuclease subunit S n=1 Tax=Lactococcus formosensis TaxID=1281486 RepID=A0A9X4P0C1_9LACT|nr:restriction endonuclease subunit S [Lactococcus formosensis]MDG6145613.1 restriction endonuclease subunit S [Lactococcus formosensis]
MSEVFLGEVAKERKETSKENKGRYPIVGLEHLIPEEITLTAWEENKENSFTKIFRKGDVLFGRRRAYLKKAVVAPFDGICSGDITVIQALPDKILPELLPFIIQNDALFDFAISKSAGSLSPRVKWENLKNFRFELPDLKEQSKLASLLWSIDSTKKTYQNLIQKTDELVKSQFIEMFGSIDSVGTFPRKQWDEVLQIINGRDYKDIADPNGQYPVYGSGGLMGRATDYLCPENTIVVGRKGTIDKPFIVYEKFWNVDTAFGVVPEQGILHYLYLFWYCKQLDFKKLNKASTLPSTTKDDLLKLWINIPPYNQQKQFADFVRQSDKSKYDYFSWMLGGAA